MSEDGGRARDPDALASARHVVLVAAGDGPLAAPLACWWDGRSLWAEAAAAEPVVAALRRNHRCAAWVAASAGGRSVAVGGRAKVFSMDDPLALALHGVPLTVAVTALRLARYGGPLRATLGLVRNVETLLPGNRAVLRLEPLLLRGEPVELPAGVAPPLPPAVPAGLRRVLGRRRTGLLALIDEDGTLHSGPVAWSAGWRLHPAPDVATVPGSPALISWEGELEGRLVGLALHGRLTDGPALAPTLVRWWDGEEVGEAQVDANPATSPIVLPD